MRNMRIFLIAFFFNAAMLASAPGRLDDLAERLARTADALASEGYRGFMDRDRGNRRDVEALFLAQQFSAGARLFERMVRERRPESELQDSVAILANQARRSSGFGFGQRSWREIQGTLDDIAGELNARGRGGYDDDRQPDRVTGRMRWRGRVDDRSQIHVQGSSATPKVVSGNPVSNAQFNFTAPLPQRAATVEVRKIKGRGSVEVIQQPSRGNSFTAVIEIFDSKGGSEEYEFELIW